MTDVARLAGVSYQTVWRVLNGRPGVRSETRDRVLRAIAELGYHPNPAASALATGRPPTTRSQVLGVVLPDEGPPGAAALLAAVSRAAARKGMGLEVRCAVSCEVASTVRAVECLLDHGTAGILLIPPVDPASLNSVAAGTPVVRLDGAPARSGRSVAVNDAAGAATATEHLLVAGHRTVWHVAGPPQSPSAAARRRGWQSALEQAGAEVPPALEATDWSAAAGYRAGGVLARRPEVSAVLAASDHLALGVLRALAEHGRVVPEQVSVVGFDDMPEAAFSVPPLTTVRVDLAVVAETAVGALLEKITGDASSRRHRTVPPCLVVRGSTAPR